MLHGLQGGVSDAILSSLIPEAVAKQSKLEKEAYSAGDRRNLSEERTPVKPQSWLNFPHSFSTSNNLAKKLKSGFGPCNWAALGSDKPKSC